MGVVSWEGDGWSHGRLFPWVEEEEWTPPDNSTTSLRHYSVLHQPTELPQGDQSDMRLPVLVLLLQHGLDSGFCLLLKRIRVPGLVWSGRSDILILDQNYILVYLVRDASLHCDFDTQGEELYSVKWYKVSPFWKLTIDIAGIKQ